jgi:putative ABC transport system permease protein
MFRVLAINVQLETYFPHWGWLPLQFSLALGPLLFFYVLKITRPDYKFQRRYLLHFSPLLLQVIAWVLEVSDSVKTGVATYNTAAFHQLNPVLQLAAFISVSTYLYLSYMLIERFYKQLEFTGGDRYRFELRWLHNLLKAFGLVWLLWIPFAFINYWGHGYHAFYPMYLLTGVMMIWIAGAAHLRSETAAQAETPSFLKPLPPSELKQKGNWLKKAVKENRYYQDPELSLGSLAEKLGLHTHELSRILNTALKKSFSDLINECRVQEVIRKMQDPAFDHITLLGIAYESGFNSQSTFSRIFKQTTGKSPAEFKNELKKDYPTYNLRSYDRFATAILPMKSNRYGMFKNYLKIAWRNLLRQRLYSAINISGLAVGLAVCMLIMLYVAHEHSYDKFHKNGDRIYTLHASIKIGGQALNMTYMSYGTGPIVKQNQPKVEDYMRTMDYDKQVIVYSPASPDVKFAENKMLYADAGFFKFFSFRLESGDPSSVLNKPFSIVISKDMAKKYFGDEDPIGKTLTIKKDSAYTYQVTGVAENAPSNSSIDFNFVASAASLLSMKDMSNRVGEQQRIGPGSFNVFLLLKDKRDTAEVKRVMQSIIKGDKRAYDDEKFSLLPLAITHLENNYADTSNVKYLKIFPIVAVLVLLLALVNYMSLSTARATLRAKEVGVRKVNGASRKNIAKQFYVESALYAFISFVLGYFLCYIFKPLFLNALKLNIDNSFLYSPVVLMLMAGLLVVTIVVAGSYPSLVLSSFNPVATLKGKMSNQSGGVTVRKIFTTLQFAISVGLIICGIVIDRQLYYMRHAETGINRENVVMIPAGSAFGGHYAAFSHDIKNLAGINEVATSHYNMFQGYDMYMVGNNPKEQSVLPAMTIDQNFISVLGLKWKFPPLPNTTLTGAHKVVINEEAIAKLHLEPNPVGSYLKSGNDNLQIMGVVKDFNYSSMEEPIKPLGLFIAPDTAKLWGKYNCSLFARIKPKTNLPTLLEAIKGVYKKYDSDTPFSYTFMDDAFNAQYEAEDRLASMFSIFTVITIVLATMGLFGLAAFTIEQRTKEIGIRKVLGASIASINGLLSKDFLKLVLLSILVGSPVAWWFMHKWLQGFAYHIRIAWWMFVGAGLLAVVVAIITVSYHAVRAAIANPVESLRSE